LASDDRLNMNQSVMLVGNGKDRNVEMGPHPLEIGITGAGVPLKLSAAGGVLEITNDDPMNTFTIRELKMEGDNVFRVVDASGNSADGQTIGPTEKKTFDVVFEPTQLGDFRANIALYLDEDPTSQTSLPVHGQALFVDAHGGGGCSTGGSTTG